jgi:putative intracellular protease/amidase
MRYSLADQTAPGGKKFTPPATGRVPVAFPISEGAVVIDFSGPWELFRDTMVPAETNHVDGFHFYTVSENTRPVTVSGGMQLIPNYGFENAPAPKAIVIPAQHGSDAMLESARHPKRRT